MSGIMAKFVRINNIKRAIKALFPDCGECRIEPGMETTLKDGYVRVQNCFWLWIDNPQTSQSFWSLDELEQYVLRKIHAMKLLQVTTPTPEARTRKDCLRRAWGRLEERELN